MHTKDMKEDWTEVSMSEKAREYYDNVFAKCYKKLQKQMRETPLTILIWGPGPQSEDPYARKLFKKRLEIRNELRRHGHAAIFSEEVEKDYPFPVSSAKANELLQAIVCDFIVMIVGSPGSLSELSDFADEVGSKMLVYINRDHIGGYTGKGVLHELMDLYENVKPFHYPNDIDECHLMTAVQSKVNTLRDVKWRMNRRTL